MGPFEVIRVIDNMVYELKLLEGINVHPVFHPWLLYIDNSNPLPGQTEAPPPSTHTNKEGSDHYVDEVVSSRIDIRRVDPATGKKGCLVYKFKWTGYTDPLQWEPYWNRAGCPDLIADFYHDHLDAAGPYKSFKTSEDWEPLIAMLLCDPRVLVQED